VSRLDGPQRPKGKARAVDLASAPAVLAYDPLIVPVARGSDWGSRGLPRLVSAMRAIAPDATPLLAVSIDDRGFVDELIRAGATLVGEVNHGPALAQTTTRAGATVLEPGPASFLGDVATKLASGWPSNRPDA
jgi:hypothetical protein